MSVSLVKDTPAATAPVSLFKAYRRSGEPRVSLVKTVQTVDA